MFSCGCYPQRVSRGLLTKGGVLNYALHIQSEVDVFVDYLSATGHLQGAFSNPQMNSRDRREWSGIAIFLLIDGSAMAARSWKLGRGPCFHRKQSPFIPPVISAGRRFSEAHELFHSGDFVNC